MRWIVSVDFDQEKRRREFISSSIYVKSTQTTVYRLGWWWRCSIQPTHPATIPVHSKSIITPSDPTRLYTYVRLHCTIRTAVGVVWHESSVLLHSPLHPKRREEKRREEKRQENNNNNNNSPLTVDFLLFFFFLSHDIEKKGNLRVLRQISGGGAIQLINTSLNIHRNPLAIYIIHDYGLPVTHSSLTYGAAS